MRKTTKAVSAILAVIMLIGVMMCAPFGVSAAETYGDFEYSLNDDNTCTITKYNGSASDLTIPSEIQGHKVIGISECGASPDYMLDSYGAFENCKYCLINCLHKFKLVIKWKCDINLKSSSIQVCIFI